MHGQELSYGFRGILEPTLPGFRPWHELHDAFWQLAPRLLFVYVLQRKQARPSLRDSLLVSFFLWLIMSEEGYVWTGLCGNMALGDSKAAILRTEDSWSRTRLPCFKRGHCFVFVYLAATADAV